MIADISQRLAHIAAYDSDNAGVFRTSTDGNVYFQYITTKELQ